jgi:hypothetical protein
MGTAKLDTEPVHLDLLVHPTEVLQQTVTAPNPTLLYWVYNRIALY